MGPTCPASPSVKLADRRTFITPRGGREHFDRYAQR
jgi:hypothetical protein